MTDHDITLRDVIAHIQGVKYDLGQRMDQMEKRMDAQFQHVDARFERMDARLKSMDARFESLERAVGKLQVQRGYVADAVDKTEIRSIETGRTVRNHERRIRKLEKVIA
jgi:hypothetical protein